MRAIARRSERRVPRPRLWRQVDVVLPHPGVHHLLPARPRSGWPRYATSRSRLGVSTRPNRVGTRAGAGARCHCSAALRRKQMSRNICQRQQDSVFLVRTAGLRASATARARRRFRRCLSRVPPSSERRGGSTLTDVNANCIVEWYRLQAEHQAREPPTGEQAGVNNQSRASMPPVLGLHRSADLTAPRRSSLGQSGDMNYSTRTSPGGFGVRSCTSGSPVVFTRFSPSTT